MLTSDTMHELFIRISVVAPFELPADVSSQILAALDHIVILAQAPITSLAGITVIDDRQLKTLPGLYAHSVLLQSSQTDEDFKNFKNCKNAQHILNTYINIPGADCAIITGDLAYRKPSLIVTDVDSTLITTEVIEMIAAAAGTEDEVRAVTTAAMRGELDFADSLKARVATLRGVSTSIFADIIDAIRFTDGALELISLAHQHGAQFGVVSGGFHEVVDSLAEQAGIDLVLANRLKSCDGYLTGEVSGPIIDAHAKAQAVVQWTDALGSQASQAACAGDGANDLIMLKQCGFGVAFCAKPIVVEHADASISFPRLDALAAYLGWDMC